MNTTPEVGTLEYCQAKLNEWNQQAEAATKERADLLERLQKAEQQLSQGHMRQKLIDDLASVAWSVLNFDNDPGREPEGPANWKALTSAMKRALENHTDRSSEAACQKLEKENSELRKALSLCSALGDDDLAFRTFGLSDKGFRLAEVRKLAVSAIHRESTK